MFETKVIYAHTMDDEIIDLCRRNGYFFESGWIKRVLGCKFENRADDRIGVGLFDDGKLIGFLGAFPISFDGRVVTNLTTGLLDESYRGKGLATDFYRFGYSELGDIITNLSPTAQVYGFLKKRIPDIKELTDYQLWFRPRKKKTNISFTDKRERILENEPEWFETVYDDNVRCRVHFLKFFHDNETCVVGYYTFKRSIIKGFEIIYSNNQVFLENHLSDILSLINSVEKAFVAFLDHIFVSHSTFDGKLSPFGTNNKVYAKRIVSLLFSKRHYIKTANRRLYWAKTRERIVLPLGHLYSEVCLYSADERH